MISIRGLLFLALSVSLALRAQSVDAFRALPKLPLEQVPLAARMANASSLGIVSSVAADRDGTIYILQRGDKADPVIALDREGKVLRSWGQGMYTVPHSIRVDPQGNIWTVDAGSSMLLKFTPQGRKLQESSVGEVAPADKCAFPPLCGTTDIAFAPDGRLYISDGYGNARILAYSADGKRLRVWGSSGTGPGQFQIPHGIAVDDKVVYVADRTNARVQRFDLDGKYLGEWTNLGRPFALKLSGGALWVAGMTVEPTGQAKGNRSTPWILKVDPATGKILGQVESPGPHALDVNAAEEAFATGCCGGSNPMSFSWLRKMR